LAEVEIRDHVLWFTNIRGDDALVDWLRSVPAGALVDLVVDGMQGGWRKMAEGAGGQPTPGLNPLTGKARAHWRRLQSRRGDFVSISLCDDA
jgi:hypothetical protein